MTTSPLPLDVGPLVAAVRNAPPRALDAWIAEARGESDQEDLAITAAPPNVRADLAALLGLDISIRLADMLAGKAPPRPEAKSVATDATFVAGRLEGRLLSLEARLDELVHNPASSPFALPSEALLWSELARGLHRADLEGRKSGWSMRVARQVMTPYRIFVRASWNDVRQTLDTMQREVTREVRALGDRALHFYRIHRILVDTTKPQVDQVTERLMKLEEDTFAAALALAIEKLPQKPSRELTRPWRDRGGIIPTGLSRSLAVVRTAFVVERDTLMSFLRALPEDLRGTPLPKPVPEADPAALPTGDAEEAASPAPAPEEASADNAEPPPLEPSLDESVAETSGVQP